ncbi:unnamed protein product [Brassica oleracea var. botrytis]|uniref:Uncharacterized protein n=1 Tax=Brassica oleracea TaxID=3712 RepID=A0A3P6CRA4_BRAOL|nr:unnamed protein product [Brassica oleracea]
MLSLQASLCISLISFYLSLLSFVNLNSASDSNSGLCTPYPCNQPPQPPSSTGYSPYGNPPPPPPSTGYSPYGNPLTAFTATFSLPSCSSDRLLQPTTTFYVLFSSVSLLLYSSLSLRYSRRRRKRWRARRRRWWNRSSGGSSLYFFFRDGLCFDDCGIVCFCCRLGHA